MVYAKGAAKKGKEAMPKIGVLTYNTVGSPQAYGNGWHRNEDREVFVASHPRGQVWGAGSGTLHETARIAAGVVQQAFEQIESNLDELDHLYVYVGDRGSEGAVALAARLPASKVTFVFCDCNLGSKRATVRAQGLSGSEEILCECGGHRTLERLVRQYLQPGQ